MLNYHLLAHWPKYFDKGAGQRERYLMLTRRGSVWTCTEDGRGRHVRRLAGAVGFFMKLLADAAPDGRTTWGYVIKPTDLTHDARTYFHACRYDSSTRPAGGPPAAPAAEA